MKFNLLRLFIYALRLSFIGIFVQCIFINLLFAGNLEARKYVSVKEVVIDINVQNASVIQLLK